MGDWCMIFTLFGDFNLQLESTFVKNMRFMKKILAFIAVASIVLASCSEYSCPTYSKKPATEKKSARV